MLLARLRQVQETATLEPIAARDDRDLGLSKKPTSHFFQSKKFADHQLGALHESCEAIKHANSLLLCFRSQNSTGRFRRRRWIRPEGVTITVGRSRNRDPRS
jgi:hypothetical protein